MKNISKYYLLLCFLFFDFAIFAQIGGGPGVDNGGGNLEGGDSIPGAPINKSLIFLVIIGIMLAFYTYRNYKKRTLI